ncbi:MAG: insulinase family protein [Caldilineaceae bacterium]|nr:insulinase family protein [Caldilineaceae bacterium]MCB9114456.1 insulinase family protein [Caldilineaceae bacterium]MCB9122500.1 insulinase family protein [Caldilineaceae bacterium]
MPLDNLIRTTLDNGLQVILRPSRRAPVASFWLFYRVGSRNETPGYTGISHWVEHMLFKGTERFPRGEFDKAVARAGGVFNGMTGQDWTVYFETFPAERIELALQVESDRMGNAIFDAEETESERTVILSEREGSENSYFYRLQEEVQAAAFQAHSYRNPVIGWQTDLLSMTRDDLYAHYRTFYTPNNAIAVVTGDFEPDAMAAQLARHFGALAPGPSVPPVRTQEPAQQAERRIILRGEDPTPYFLQAFHAPPATHPDFFATVVLDSVLGGAKGLGIFGGSANNRNNRLYRALVERQLTVDVASSVGPTIDTGLFTISATLAPGVTHAQVEEAIWHELERIQRDGVEQAEVERAIKQTKAQFVFSSESVTYEAYWLGFSEVVASLDWLNAWVEQLAAVTPEDVQRVAQKSFARHRQTVGWYVPEGEEE